MEHLAWLRSAQTASGHQRLAISPYKNALPSYPLRGMALLLEAKQEVEIVVVWNFNLGSTEITLQVKPLVFFRPARNGAVPVKDGERGELAVRGEGVLQSDL